MRDLGRQILIAALFGAVTFAPHPVSAEMVEEIVAWVNGDIITRSDLESEEQLMLAEAYRRFAGEELDRTVQELRKNILMQMIDRKILVDYAQRYDLERMRESYYEAFRDQQEVESDAEFERLLAKEGLSVEDMKDRLIEMFAPDDVIRFEVRGRVSVGDREVEAFYETTPSEFTIPGEASVREIVLLVPDRAVKKQRRDEIETLRERLVAGADFAKIAAEASESGTKDKGGLLGPVARGDLARKLDEAVFALPVGEISKIIETEHGFHLIKVESRREPELQPLDEVREQVRSRLEELKFRVELETFLVKARAQADWCVKTRYHDRVPEPHQSQTCQSL